MMTLLEEENMAETSRGIPQDSFTILDFVRVFRALCPEDWRRLVERFGEFGKKGRYTVTTYPSNGLDSYSQKPDSLLIPLTHYSKDRLRDHGRTTKEEEDLRQSLDRGFQGEITGKWELRKVDGGAILEFVSI